MDPLFASFATCLKLMKLFNLNTRINDTNHEDNSLTSVHERNELETKAVQSQCCWICECFEQWAGCLLLKHHHLGHNPVVPKVGGQQLGHYKGAKKLHPNTEQYQIYQSNDGYVV